MKNYYETIYARNKDMFIRLFRRDGQLLPSDSSDLHYFRTWEGRYCILRAAMDVEGIEFILKKMLEENWPKRYKNFVCLAWHGKFLRAYHLS